MSSTDHLGRELDAGGEAQTVTEFAVQQGTVDPDAPGVREGVEADRERAEQHTQRAEQVSARMAPEQGLTVGSDQDPAEDDDQG